MLRLPLRTPVLTVGLIAFLSGIGLQSQGQPPILPAEPLIVVGSGPGAGYLAVSKSDGTPIVALPPFGAGFTGGVRVAAGDIDADGVTDVVAAMAGNGGEVRAYSGSDGSLLGSVVPFGPNLSGGVFVAVGDVNGDGHDDILLGAGSGGLAQLIDGATRTVLGTGRPFPLPYSAGVTVALGDLNGDGRADLIFGTTLGGFVRVLDFPSLTPTASGFPYGPLFTGGVNVAAGDVDGDGVDEIAVAPRNAGGPVKVYTARAELVIEGAPFDAVQGVNLAMGDLNGDGLDDLLMGAGAGSTSRVRAFSILNQTSLYDEVAFDAGFRGGVFVATAHSAGPPVPETRFTSAATTTFTAGAAGTFAITTENGSGATVSAGGTLPAGVTFTNLGNGMATLAGTPAAGSGGSYPLTFVASRGGSQVAQQSFTLVVQQAAAITSASAETFVIGAASTFTVTTTGHPVTTITATGSLPAGVTFTNNGNGTATLAGSPAAGSGGIYPITITAANGAGAPATQTFTLTVLATFNNPSALSIPDAGTATPYPSVVTVSGVVDTAFDVSVTLNGFSHSSPDDVGMLLVGPTGQAIVLTNGGTDAAIAGANLTFSSSGTPWPTSGVVGTGTYRPESFYDDDTFPISAPLVAGTNPTEIQTYSFSAFHGTDLNGDWSLYVFDLVSAGNNLGQIAGGWSLTLTPLVPAAIDRAR